jgi:YD repeat-containing protein
MVNDVMGKPMKTWDSRNHVFRFEYDNLHRPVKSFVASGDTAEINFSKITYGEDVANGKALNLRGKGYRQFDAAGIVTNIEYDFKGNLLRSSRQLCSDYKNDIDWNTNPALDEETFISSTEYDALNRPITVTAPDSSIITPSYNEANLLEKVEVQLKGAADKTVFVKDINYDEKGQRENIIYGNDTKTNYSYDKNTFRLTQLITNRKNENDAIQKLSYTYDPVGNITYIKMKRSKLFSLTTQLLSPLVIMCMMPFTS